MDTLETSENSKPDEEKKDRAEETLIGQVNHQRPQSTIVNTTQY